MSNQLPSQCRHRIGHSCPPSCWVRELIPLCNLPQLEVDDRLNQGSSREVHADDSKTLVQVGLGPQVVVQLWIDALGDGSGISEHTSSAAEREENLGHVSCGCSLQVVIDTLPFLLHVQESGHLWGLANAQPVRYF